MNPTCTYTGAVLSIYSYLLLDPGINDLFTKYILVHNCN